MFQNASDNSSGGAVERVIGHFALIATAGECATKAGITGWQPGDAWKSAFELLKEWAEAQDRSEQYQIDAAVSRTRAYLLTQGDTRFEKAGSTPLANRDGYRDDTWFYISGDTWNEIHVGHSPTDQAKHLIAGGWMAGGDGKNLMSKTPAWVPGRPRAYKVRAEILDTPPGASLPPVST